MSRASLSVACAVAGLVSLAGLAGCASVDSIGASIGAVPLHDTVKGAFIDTAIDRVKVHYRLAPGVSNPRSMPGPITTTRAFSGEPSLKSQDDLRIVEESGGIVESRPAQLYLQQVLDRLLAHWPYETPRIGVFITSTPAFGAVATGEGDILINAGSLLAFSSEDELAAMLAHEAAHILLKHHARSEQVKANKRMMNAIAEMALTYTMVRNTRFQKVGRGQFVVSERNPKALANQATRVAATCIGTRYFIDRIVDPGWSRTQEDEADLLAADLVHRAGYNLNGNVQALQIQKQFEGDSSKRLLVQRRSENGEYDKILENAVKTNGIGGIVSGMTTVVTQGVVNTLQDLDQQLSNRHHATDLRQKSLQAYISRQYAGREPRDASVARFRSTLATGGMKAFLKAHEQAFEASRHLDNEKFEEAETLARLAIRPPAHQAAATRFAMYRVLAQKGDADGAFKQLLAIRDIDRAAGSILMTYALELDRRGRSAEAIRYARLGAGRIGLNAGAGGKPGQGGAKTNEFALFFGGGSHGLCDRVNADAQRLVNGLGGTGTPEPRTVRTDPKLAAKQLIEIEQRAAAQQQAAQVASQQNGASSLLRNLPLPGLGGLPGLWGSGSAPPAKAP